MIETPEQKSERIFENRIARRPQGREGQEEEVRAARGQDEEPEEGGVGVWKGQPLTL